MSTVDVAVPETQSSDPEWSFAVGGQVVSGWDWGAGPPDVRQLGSVRKVRSSTYSRNVPVHAFSMTIGDDLTLESGLEHQLMMMLDRDRDVAWLVALAQGLGSGRLGPRGPRWRLRLRRRDEP